VIAVTRAAFNVSIALPKIVDERLGRAFRCSRSAASPRCHVPAVAQS
jgi:hypothetical protein